MANVCKAAICGEEQCCWRWAAAHSRSMCAARQSRTARTLGGMNCFLPGGDKSRVGSRFGNAEINKQEIRDLMMLVVVDQRTGEKAFTALALFSIRVEAGGSQAWIKLFFLGQKEAT